MKSTTNFYPHWIVILGLLIGTVKAADQVPSGVHELVIRNGQMTSGGQQKPATLRNIVELLTERWPRVQINIVGADDVVIQDISVRAGRRMINANELVEPSPLSLLMAIRAASGNSFEVQPFGPNEFLLSQPQTRQAEVFNLAGVVKPGRVARMHDQLRDLEREAKVQKRIKTETHPDVKALHDRMAELKIHIDEAGGLTPAPEKLVAEIESVVQSTLRLLKSAESVPTFSYHPGSNLLIVAGGEQALNVTRKVVAALTKTD